MSQNIPLSLLLTERAVRENIVRDIEVTDTTITVTLTPKLQSYYERPDCQSAVSVSYHDDDTLLVQGLGIQGKALRYQVRSIRAGYLNDAGKFCTFMIPIPGIRTNLLVTDEVIDKMLYLNIDCNHSFPMTVQMLRDLYGISTSVSARERWKNSEADSLPSVGQLIQQLNAKKPITTLPLDEYKATGTKNWELAIRDEHGRLLFSIRLKQRDAWHIKAILRWFRILGLDISLIYVDFWLASPSALKAIYPNADLQYDFFHVIQNIHRHLYKALTAYRKAFKTANTEPEHAAVRQELHKKLWRHRYLLFTNEENLTDEQRTTLDELVSEHAETIVEQIVLFRQQLRTIFNDCDTFAEAVEYLAVMLLDGWGEVSKPFGKVMTFLHTHFEQMLTYLRKPNVQRNSLSECTVRSLRRIERIRQGFKKQKGRVRHLKLLQWRKYLCPAG
jgi:hypothetical protein